MIVQCDFGKFHYKLLLNINVISDFLRDELMTWWFILFLNNNSILNGRERERGRAWIDLTDFNQLGHTLAWHCIHYIKYDETIHILNYSNFLYYSVTLGLRPPLGLMTQLKFCGFDVQDVNTCKGLDPLYHTAHTETTILPDPGKQTQVARVRGEVDNQYTNGVSIWAVINFNGSSIIL